MEFDQASRGHKGCSTSGKIQGCCRRDVGLCYFSNFLVKFSINYRDRISFFNKFFAMVDVFNFRSDILWPLCTRINIIYLHFSYDAEFQKCYMEKMRLKVGFPFLKQHDVQIFSFLQSGQAKHTPKYCNNEFIIYSKVESVGTLKTHLMPTSVIQSSRYYSPFFWSSGKNHRTFSCKTLINSLIRPPG